MEKRKIYPYSEHIFVCISFQIFPSFYCLLPHWSISIRANVISFRTSAHKSGNLIFLFANNNVFLPRRCAFHQYMCLPNTNTHKRPPVHLTFSDDKRNFSSSSTLFAVADRIFMFCAAAAAIAAGHCTDIKDVFVLLCTQRISWTLKRYWFYTVSVVRGKLSVHCMSTFV